MNNRPGWADYLERRQRQGPHRAPPPAGRRRGHPPAPALLLDLEGHRRRRARRPVRPAPDRGRGGRPGHRLLRRARRDPRPVAPGRRPVQGLHRLAEEQPLPVAAHHRHRPGRPPRRGADPHRDDAPLRRVRRRHRLPLPARRPRPPTRPAPTSSTGCSGCSTGSRTPPTPASSSRRCAATSPRPRSQSSPTAGRSCCPAGSTPVDLAYELGADTGRPVPRPRRSTAGWRRCSPLHDGDVVEIFTRDRRPREVDPTAPRGPPQGVARLRQVDRRRRCRSAASSTSTNEPASRSPTRCGWAGPTIGLTLRKHDRGLASDLPLRRLAEELGYPDLETLLVAVVDRNVRAGHRGRAAHRAGRPPGLSTTSVRPDSLTDVSRPRAATRATRTRSSTGCRAPVRRRLVRLVVPKYHRRRGRDHARLGHRGRRRPAGCCCCASRRAGAGRCRPACCNARERPAVGAARELHEETGIG